MESMAGELSWLCCCTCGESWLAGHTGVFVCFCFAAARAIEQVVSLIVLTRLRVANAHVASFTKGR